MSWVPPFLLMMRAFNLSASFAFRSRSFCNASILPKTLARNNNIHNNNLINTHSVAGCVHSFLRITESPHYRIANSSTLFTYCKKQAISFGFSNCSHNKSRRYTDTAGKSVNLIMSDSALEKSTAGTRSGFFGKTLIWSF